MQFRRRRQATYSFFYEISALHKPTLYPWGSILWKPVQLSSVTVLVRWLSLVATCIISLRSLQCECNWPLNVCFENKPIENSCYLFTRNQRCTDFLENKDIVSKHF